MPYKGHKYTPEERAAYSAAAKNRWANMTPEERDEIGEKISAGRRKSSLQVQAIRCEVDRELDAAAAERRARRDAIIAAARPIFERVERAKALKNAPKPDAYGIIKLERPQ